MPFPKRVFAETPTSVGAVVVTLHNADGLTAVKLRAQILNQNGAEMGQASFDLWTHLTAAQQTAISNFIQNIRDRANLELI